MKFREHRGGLAESLETMVELPANHYDLLQHCRQLLAPYKFNVNHYDLHVRPYDLGPDTRIGWPQTYIVMIDGYGVIGYTDQEPE